MGDLDVSAIRARVADAGVVELRAMVAALCAEVGRLRVPPICEIKGCTQAAPRFCALHTENGYRNVLRFLLDRTRKERDEARAEVERLRAVIDGSMVAPTDAEIEAHAKAGGAWLHSDAADGALVVCQDGWQARTMRCRPGRWWALGPDGLLRARPEVAP